MTADDSVDTPTPDLPECPYCGALPGHYCNDARGIVKDGHPERRDVLTDDR